MEILKYVYTPMMRQYFAKAKKGKEIALVEKTLICEFKKIVDHIEKDDLMFNIKKCKIMLFGTRKRIKNQSVRLIYRDNHRSCK